MPGGGWNRKVGIDGCYDVLPDDCWQWKQFIDSDGYGHVTREGSSGFAHRYSYTHHKGPIPDGFEIDHLCRNRACVNPDHLEVVTHSENVRRSAPAVKTHCVNGHEFTEANTYRSPKTPTRRGCRACNRDNQRACTERRLRRLSGLAP